MIDLSQVRDVLHEIEGLVAELDGLNLDETDAVTSQSKGAVRQEKARRSQQLQMLATRFELGAALVRIEYWHARGEIDPLDHTRSYNQEA